MPVSPSVARPSDHQTTLEALPLLVVSRQARQVCVLLIDVPLIKSVLNCRPIGPAIGNSSMRTTSKGEGSASWSSMGFTPRKMTSEDDNVFSFRETRVQEYLSSLSEAESSSRDSEEKVVDPFAGKSGWVYKRILLNSLFKSDDN